MVWMDAMTFETMLIIAGYAAIALSLLGAAMNNGYTMGFGAFAFAGVCFIRGLTKI
jgi:hypothetical protein